jgi:hypothetical protein
MKQPELLEVREQKELFSDKKLQEIDFGFAFNEN